MTALHYAAYCNDPDAVRAALRQGIPVDVRDDGTWTPLHWSIDMSQAWGEPAQVVSLLLAAGASPNSVDNCGRSVLTVACGRDNESILVQLIDAGADVRARCLRGSTPLHEAARSGFTEAIRRLLLLGADPNVMDVDDRTAVDLAEESDLEENVAMLKAARSATLETGE